jgi:hypothetical protein
MKTRIFSITFLLSLLFIMLFSSCSNDNASGKDEEIRVQNDSTVNIDTASTNTLDGSLSLSQIASYPSQVILTGLPDERLVTIYRKVPDRNKTLIEEYSSRARYYDDGDNDRYTHFMPGIDVQFGYNLINIGHYNFQTEKLQLLFDHPVLVRSLYYPSFEQDSIKKKPINRDYFFVSVYNQDTNQDTVINKTDLRRFIYFNATATVQQLLIPADYSVERSQYDGMRDVMYIFARHDANKNGKTEKTEPVHVFWIDLVKPTEAKRMY